MVDDPHARSRPIRLLTYNLWHGKAQRELPQLVADNSVDVLCLQEGSSSSLPERLGDLELAITTPFNRLAVALYVRQSRFEVEHAETVQLTISRHDRYVGGTDQRLAVARVFDRVSERDLVLGSFHASPFTDSNALRRRQIDDAHRAIAQLGPGLPSAMAGDYNHPILLSMLRRHLKRQGVDLTSTSTTTFQKEGSLMRGRFDLATTSKMDVATAEVLPGGASDHKPVLFTFDYSA